MSSPVRAHRPERSNVSDGQRIFRLLANGILFGKDRIVIRYFWSAAN